MHTHKEQSCRVETYVYPLNILFYGLVALSVTLTLSYLSKATSKEVDINQQGEYLLRMHKLYYIVGITALVIGAIFLVAPLITEDKELALYVIIFLMLIIFGGLGLLSVLFYKRHYVLFDDTNVEVASPFGSTSTLLWSEIVKANFNPSSGLLTLISKTGAKVRVHYHLVGFPKFVEHLEDYTTLTAKQLKLPIPKK